MLLQTQSLKMFVLYTVIAFLSVLTSIHYVRATIKRSLYDNK